MAGRIILRDMILKHDVPVSTRYGVTHILVFYSDKYHTTWVWKTTKLTNFKEHCKYSIEATDEGNFYISHVKDLNSKSDDKSKSEQPSRVQNKPNALDILLPDMHLTNDEKYNIITVKGGEKDV